MKRFRWIFMIAFVGGAVFSLGALSSDAYAQDTQGVKQNDRDIGARKGIKESLAGPADKMEDTGMPSKTQMIIGALSTPVMLIVIKYL